MKIREWLEIKGMNIPAGAKMLHVSATQLRIMLDYTNTPSIEMAYRVEVFSKGEISMQDLLRDKVVEMYKNEQGYTIEKGRAIIQTVDAATAKHRAVMAAAKVESEAAQKKADAAKAEALKAIEG